MSKRLVIILDCGDRPGIVARISAVFKECGWNLDSVEERTQLINLDEPERGKRFFMRAHATALEDATDPRADLEQVVCKQLGGHLREIDPSRRVRIGLLMSQEPDCPTEIINQCLTGDIPGQVVALIANQPDLERLRHQVEAPYKVIPHEKGTEREAERQMIQLLRQANVDLVVMARYMRVLSGEMISEFTGRIINIHHSTLPAFPGSNPYRQAWEHGVKVIGATAHFATEKLDDGPIIAQGTRDVGDQETVQMMKRSGARVEREVLTEAVRAYAEGRIIIDGRKTIVFRPDPHPYGTS